jgi:hypothetical protein
MRILPGSAIETMFSGFICNSLPIMTLDEKVQTSKNKSLKYLKT